MKLKVTVDRHRTRRTGDYRVARRVNLRSDSIAHPWASARYDSSMYPSVRVMRDALMPRTATATTAVAVSRTSVGSTGPSAVHDRSMVGAERATNSAIHRTTITSAPSASHPLRGTRAESLRTSPLNFVIAAIPMSDGPPTNVMRLVAVSVAAIALRGELFGRELIADDDRPRVWRVVIHNSDRYTSSLEEVDEPIATVLRR